MTNAGSCGVVRGNRLQKSCKSHLAGECREDEHALLTRRLEEAQFLLRFCQSVHAPLEPKDVCAVAAERLYHYFKFQLALFNFDRTTDLESATFFHPEPESAVGERAKIPLTMLPMEKAAVSSYRTTNEITENVITIAIPAGLGELHLYQVQKASDEISADFLQGIADSLETALCKALVHRRLRELSMRDELTGLLNRRSFDELLDIEWQRRDDSLVSLLFIDLDDFKSINDRFGHPTGDQVIAAAAKAIRESCRGADLAGRYGGEEFAVLLPGTTLQSAQKVAERLRACIESLSFKSGEHQFQVTASIGVANLSRMCHLTGKQLLQLADDALYRAKRSGKNHVVTHEFSSAGLAPVTPVPRKSVEAVPQAVNQKKRSAGQAAFI